MLSYAVDADIPLMVYVSNSSAMAGPGWISDPVLTVRQQLLLIALCIAQRPSI
jgi:hypothetical protein